MKARQTQQTHTPRDDGLGESDASEARENDFFDDEALESAESTDEESDSDEEDIDPFPFTRLPPELRVRVWTLFCPDLLGAPRVLDFDLQQSLSPTRNSPCWVVGPGRSLEDQTRALRCVLATNQESRAIAKKKFPDELCLESENGEDFTMCLNLKADIAMLNMVPNVAPEFELSAGHTTEVRLDGFSQFIVNLALPLHDEHFTAGVETDVTSWLRKFRCLQRVFFYTTEEDCTYNSVRWCASTHARQYYMETFEKEPGYGEDWTVLICWPDAEKSPSFTKAHVPKWATRFMTSTQEESFQEAGVKIYPMVTFESASGLRLFDQLVATDYLPLKVYETNNVGSDAESDVEESDFDEDFELTGVIEGVDAYESDGIDDDEPEIFQESADEHLDDGDSGDSDRDDAPPNPFSSPEPSEAEADAPVRGRKRRVLLDSDDEDNEEPSTRPAKRKRIHVIDSDDEQTLDEAADPQISSSSSDEDGAPAKRRKVEVVDIADSDDSREDDDDQPQHASLTNRLQIRSRRRVAPSDEEDSEEADEEDDEEEEEDDEDDDEEDEDGLIDNMAAESGEDEDEEDEEDE